MPSNDRQGHHGQPNSLAVDHDSVIVPELEFRRRPTNATIGKHQVTVSRWTSPCVSYPLELQTEPKLLDDCHVLTHALEPTDAELMFSGKIFFNQRIAQNDLLLTGPYQPIRSIQRKPSDGIRIYLPQTLFVECYEIAHRREPRDQIVVSDPRIIRDQMLERMIQMILLSNKEGGRFVPTFVEGISAAIATRLLQLDSMLSTATVQNQEPLAKWRLKRALEYIEENISRPIYLAELGNVAGLSSMRFSTQFRASTNYSPHEFILRRKIVRAQQLLADPRMKLADVALSLGFHSQGHLSLVFRKFVGETPGRWRKASCATPSPERQAPDWD